MKKSKPPLERGDQFGSLDECRKFLRLPEKKIRALRRLGLIRLPGGMTTPADLRVDWQAHAGALREAGPRPRPVSAPAGWPSGPRKGRVPAVAPIAANFETWQAAQGSSTQS